MAKKKTIKDYQEAHAKKCVKRQEIKPAKTFRRRNWTAENGIIVGENHEGDLTLILHDGKEINIPLIGRTALAMWFYDKMISR